MPVVSSSSVSLPAPAQAPRRRALLAMAPTVLLAPWALRLAHAAGPRYTVTREEIEDVLKERFPRRYPVSNLVNLVAQAPRIGLKPETNRLNADMALEATGPVLRRAYQGRLNVDFGLRYEAKDRTLRAHNLQLNALDFPDLAPEAALLLSQYAPQIASQSLGEVVLHTLRAEDLALTDGLGMQPGAITVTDRGLAIELVPKPLS